MHPPPPTRGGWSPEHVELSFDFASSAFGEDRLTVPVRGYAWPGGYVSAYGKGKRPASKVRWVTRQEVKEQCTIPISGSHALALDGSVTS